MILVTHQQQGRYGTNAALFVDVRSIFILVPSYGYSVRDELLSIPRFANLDFGGRAKLQRHLRSPSSIGSKTGAIGEPPGPGEGGEQETGCAWGWRQHGYTNTQIQPYTKYTTFQEEATEFWNMMYWYLVRVKPHLLVPSIYWRMSKSRRAVGMNPMRDKMKVTKQVPGGAREDNCDQCTACPECRC